MMPRGSAHYGDGCRCEGAAWEDGRSGRDREGWGGGGSGIAQFEVLHAGLGLSHGVSGCPGNRGEGGGGSGWV